jgi:para-aminobenzoate synthetase component 1
MKYNDRKETIKLMDEWGGKHVPFLFFIDYHQSQCYIERVEDIDDKEVLYQFEGATNHAVDEAAKARILREMYWKAMPEDFDQYSMSFKIVKDNLLEGNSFLTNLTCATPVTTNLSLKDIYTISKAKYKLYVEGAFVVFSPEIFVRINDRTISSYPMKGTIDATLPDAEQTLMDDTKEAAEHATITDLIRNDLSMVAEHVEVTRYRYVDRLKTSHGPILQTSSEISGVLPPDYHAHLGELFFQLLPAGSITGAPKVKTMKIIESAENYNRGFYSGVMGYYDGHYLDSAVMIRFVEQQPDGGMLYKSGGGITFQSDIHSEYEEMKQKIYVPIY